MKAGLSELPFVDVCAEAELAVGSVTPRVVNGRALLLCRSLEGVHAIASRCTHAAWLLEDGTLRECEIECSLHGARFDVRTGEATLGPASKPLRTFPVRVRDGRVEVQAPPPVS